MVYFIAGPYKSNTLEFDSIFITKVDNLSFLVKVVRIQNGSMSLPHCAMNDFYFKLKEA